jgi:hypothetical protein
VKCQVHTTARAALSSTVRRQKRRVSTDPSPKAKPMDLVAALQHDRKVALVYWTGIVFMAGVLIVCWFDGDVGPSHPIYGLLLVGWTLMLGPGLVTPCIRFLPLRWCRVPAGERVIHRILGVSIFGWVLERSGWNRRTVYPVWGFSITRTHLAFRALAARAGGGAHAACFAIHMLLAAVALFGGTGGAHCGSCCPASSFIFTRCSSSAPSCCDFNLCCISPARDL